MKDHIASGHGYDFRQTTLHKAELYNMVAATALLHIWEKYAQATDDKTTVWCYNSSLVQCIN